MQNPPINHDGSRAGAPAGAPSVGDAVRVRRGRWRVADVCRHERCSFVTLVGIGHGNAGRSLRVISPFDAVEPLDDTGSMVPRIIGPVAWRRRCRALIGSDSPPGTLIGVRQARMDLLPYQLEPALALVRGAGSRVLLADDVGLGKTVQAGVIASELRARGAADRMLVLTPPGLREQWVCELRERFSIEASIVDAGALARQSSFLPVGVNPWSTFPVCVTSIDFAKRLEVLPAVAGCTWDLVIVDEAHGAVGASDRHGAVAAIASRAPYVVLVTATPHSGNRDDFLSLCACGAVDGDRMLLFRRTRLDVGMASRRRIHRLDVRPSAEEARVQFQLRRLTRAIRAERGDAAWLALSVLHKRSLSSAYALEQSVTRRLHALLGAPEEADGQLSLPIEPVDETRGEATSEDEPPPWPAGLALRDVEEERHLLEALRRVAAAAARRETKMAAIARLLRRVDEPAIVFTEYRDTLQHLERCLGRPSILLHGGMTREERASALARFALGGHVALLATDAAGQGLNLHATCRLVVNLELPWNPMRLEQRIGRVDRMGQPRTVHVVHLVARDTGEPLIFDRLNARVAAARADIRAANPLGSEAEREIARLIVGDGCSESHEPGDHRPRSGVESELVEPALSAVAVAEAARLARQRAITPPAQIDADRGGWRTAGPAIYRTRRSDTRARLKSRTVLLWRREWEDGCGRVIATAVVPLVVRSALWRVGTRGLLQRFGRDLQRRAELVTEAWQLEVVGQQRAFASTRLARERAIAKGGLRSQAAFFQPGLFDRRNHVARAAAVAATRAVEGDTARRLAVAERGLEVVAKPARLMLVLDPAVPEP